MTTTTWTHRQARFTEPRSFPVENLARAMGLDPNAWDLTNQLQVRLGLERSWVRRCRRHGLTAKGADHWATLAGLHPDIVWPGWWDDPGDTSPMPDEDDPPVDTLDGVILRCVPVPPWKLAAS